MLKRFGIGLFVVCLFWLALFPRQFFLLAAEQITKAYFKRTFQSQLQFEQLKWEAGHIILGNGKLAKKGVYEATFSSAAFKPILSLSSRHWGGALTLMQLDVIHQSAEPFPTFKKAQRHFPLFTPYFSIHLQQGSLTNVHTDQKFKIDLVHELKGGEFVGELTLYTDMQPLEFFFLSSGKEIEIQTRFNEHSLKGMHYLATSFIRPLLPQKILDGVVHTGVVSGSLIASIDEGQLDRCEGHLSMTNLHVFDKQAGCEIESEKVQVDFDLQQAHPEKAHAHFRIHDTHCFFQEGLLEGKGDIHQFQAELNIDGGCLIDGTLCGRFFGLDVEGFLDWNNPQSCVEIQMKGKSKDLITFLPQSYQKKGQLVLGQDAVTFKASCSQISQGMQCQGLIQLGSSIEVPFGCQWGDSSFLTHLYEYSFINVEALLLIIKQQFSFSHNCLGWFKGEQLPIERFLAPFIIGDYPIRLSGLVDIEGSFDDRHIVIFHKGKKIKLEGEGFKMTIPSYDSQAVHSIDIQTKEHVGYMPVTDASYLQKSCHFQAQSISGLIRFENNRIYISDMHSDWQTLPLVGEVDVTIHSFDNIDIKLYGGCVEANAKEALALLNHFYPHKLSGLPIEGSVDVPVRQLFFHFNLGPEFSVVTGKVEGDLRCCASKMGLGLDEFLGHFKYEQRHFEIQDIQAHLVTPLQNSKLTEGFLKLGSEGAYFSASMQDDQGFSYPLEGSLEKGHLFAEAGTYFKLRSHWLNHEGVIDELKWGDLQLDGTLEYPNSQPFIAKLSMSHPFIGIGDVEMVAKQSFCDMSGRFEIKDCYLQQLTSLCTPIGPLQGCMRGVGIFSWNPAEDFSLHMKGDCENLGFGFLDLGHAEHWSVYYTPQQGLRIEGLEQLSRYKLGALHYDFKNKHVYIEGLDFSLDQSHLIEGCLAIKDLYPDKFSEVGQRVINLFQQEGLDGRLWLDWSPERTWVHLKLKEGPYQFLDQTWDLQNISLTYDPLEIILKASVTIKKQEVQLKLSMDADTLQSGQIVLQDDVEEDILVGAWKKESDGGVIIEKVEGTLGGFSCDLRHVSSNQGKCLQLSGTVAVDPEKACNFLPYRLQHFVSDHQITGRYNLSGLFSLPLSSNQPTFSGLLNGDDCGLRGIKVASFTSACKLSVSEIELQDVAIRDWAGNLFCNHLSIKPADDWAFFAKCVAVRDFRPHRLQGLIQASSKNEKSALKTLFITHCELLNFEGLLGDPNSFEGKGLVTFTNLPKRTLISNLMIIPTEITARIGLDITNFIPVRGTIHYDMKQGRVYLSDFQDVYSDAKRSQFFLADNFPSYVSLNGGLHLFIKMKQYNLLMKLAELFTVTIKGSVLDPQYLLTPQES